MQERRRFERVNIPESAHIYIEDRFGKRVGTVRVLGRGGLFLQTQEYFRDGSVQQLVLVSEQEDIRRPISVVVRRTDGEGVAFEFFNLAPDAAVEIGVIIGRYYSAQGAGK